MVWSLVEPLLAQAREVGVTPTGGVYLTWGSIASMFAVGVVSVGALATFFKLTVMARVRAEAEKMQQQVSGLATDIAVLQSQMARLLAVAQYHPTADALQSLVSAVGAFETSIANLKGDVRDLQDERRAGVQ